MALVNVLELLTAQDGADETLDLSGVVSDVWTGGDTPYLPRRTDNSGGTIGYRLGDLQPPPGSMLVCEGPETEITALGPGVPIFVGDLIDLHLRGGTSHAYGPVVVAEHSTGCRFEGLSVVDLQGVGFDLGDVRDVTFLDVEFHQGYAVPLGTAIVAGPGVGLAIEQCKFQEIDAGVQLAPNGAELAHVTIRGSWFERVSQGGVRAESGVHRLNVVDSYFEANGAGGTADLTLNEGGGADGVSCTVADCTFANRHDAQPSRIAHAEHVCVVVRDCMAVLGVDSDDAGVPLVEALGSLDGVAVWLLRNRLKAEHAKPYMHCQVLHPDSQAACIEIELHTLSRFAYGLASVCGATCP